MDNMTKISQNLQEFYSSSREFLRTNGLLSREFEDRLKVSTAIKKDLESLVETVHEISAVEEVPTVKSLNNTYAKLILGDYIPMTSKIAALSSTLQDIDGLGPHIPEVVQVKVNEVKGYLSNIETKMAGVDDAVRKIAEKLNKACESGFESSTWCKELECSCITVNSGLKTCTQYVEGTEEVLAIINTEAKTKLLTPFVLGAVGLGTLTIGGWPTLPVLIVAGAAVALYTMVGTGRTRTGSEESKTGLMTDIVTCYPLQSILAKHSNRITEVNSLNSKLQQTRLLYEEMHGTEESGHEQK